MFVKMGGVGKGRLLHSVEISFLKKASSVVVCFVII